jgi:hypothetical protein
MCVMGRKRGGGWYLCLVVTEEEHGRVLGLEGVG